MLLLFEQVYTQPDKVYEQLQELTKSRPTTTQQEDSASFQSAIEPTTDSPTEHEPQPLSHNDSQPLLQHDSQLLHQQDLTTAIDAGAASNSLTEHNIQQLQQQLSSDSESNSIGPCPQLFSDSE